MVADDWLSGCLKTIDLVLKKHNVLDDKLSGSKRYIILINACKSFFYITKLHISSSDSEAGHGFIK